MKTTQPVAIRLQDYQPPAWQVSRVRLHVDLHDDHSEVTAWLQLERRTAGPLVLDGRELELRSVQVDGQDWPHYQQTGDGLTLEQVPDRFELRTVVRIHPERNTSLEGLYRSRTMFCTQCEAQGFRKITYYPDRPDVLALFDVTVEADAARYPVLLGNGNPAETGQNGSRHWARWIDPWPKPSYLFALVAGDLAFVEDRFVTTSGRDVRLRIYVEAKDLDKCAFAMDSLKRSMRWDEDTYGREYDLDVFNIVAVDDFNMGAMENKGLNIFNTSAVLAHPDVTTDAGYQRVEGVVAHEYFHNWSGNRVTCRDWFQLSLKEGFTVFRDSEFSADMGSRAAKRIDDVALLRSVQFPEDAGPMAHPVQPASYQEISNFYTTTVYEKGAEVVRMIRNLLGAEVFRQGCDRYFAQHDGQAVTIDEFLAAMQAVSGRDFSQFRRWYTQSGTPRVQASGRYDAEAKTYTLRIAQSCPPTPGQAVKQPFHIPLAMGLVGEGGSLPLHLRGDTQTDACLTRVLDLTESEQVFVFENVHEAPVPSLLRGFSAPVRLDMDLDDEALLFLARHDDDGFVRYEACQRLMCRAILQSAAGGSDALPASLNTLVAELLAQPSGDAAVQAMMLALPSVSFLVDQSEACEPLAMCQARERIRSGLCAAQSEAFRRCFEALIDSSPYRADGASIARRQLRHVCLAYWTANGDAAAVQAAQNLYRQADNVTERLAAINALLNSPTETARAAVQPLLSDFMARWGHEPLAVNLWLQSQAWSVHSDLTAIRTLMAHPAFEITNPNKVRSVIGAFCNGNPWHFHAEDGSGYAFLAEQVLHLNALNPQIASRLLTPLTRWQKYAPAVAERMLRALRQVNAAENLSPDVQEVVLKSLADA